MLVYFRHGSLTSHEHCFANGARAVPDDPIGAHTLTKR